jgi:methionine--tRNA ligase beta chain
MISFDDFKKIDLRVAKIISAEKVENSEKLIKLEIDLGTDFPDNPKRTLLAGISKFYNPDDLIGREIIMVANLEPKSMMGMESQGMLLAAVEDGKPILIKPESEVSPGTKVQ